MHITISPVLVQPVLPPDPLQHLDLAAHQPVARLVDHLEKIINFFSGSSKYVGLKKKNIAHLDVGVPLVVEAPGAGAALLLVVRVDLKI